MVPALPTNRSNDPHPEHLVRLRDDQLPRHFAHDVGDMESPPSASWTGFAHDDHGVFWVMRLLAIDRKAGTISCGMSPVPQGESLIPRPILPWSVSRFTASRFQPLARPKSISCAASRSP